MKASEIVESIKEVLGMELAEIKVELEERELQNGTKITAEKFEEGASVFILTESGDEEEKIALPVGNYEMNDGTVLVVSQEGKIGEIREASDEVPATEEDLEEDLAVVEDWEGMEKRIQNLEDAVASLKADKEEMKEVVVEEKVEASKVELNSIEVAADPISHNPEKTVKKERVKFGNNRPMSTKDKVLQIINNN
jgi:hypothetical protein